ncbi:MAG TPA: cyanophycin synthetase, partial [Candidatus Saccharimonadales bacterium]|nr:cyanophycin synthetase [Candidatus Saccharimonadales bacterium]
IYPTRESYLQAFNEFVGQSGRTILWLEDAEKLGLDAEPGIVPLDQDDVSIDRELILPGHVNRLDAWLVMRAFYELMDEESGRDLTAIMNKFPGLSRRFEKIANNIYSDYAHTPPKIRGALQLAREVAGDNVVVVYEGLHNTRQHFIKDQLADLFNEVKHLYIVPSYLAREDKNLELLTPDKLLDLLSNLAGGHSEPATLDDDLATRLARHAEQGDLVLCLSAGGGGSLDEWLRRKFAKN